MVQNHKKLIGIFTQRLIGILTSNIVDTNTWRGWYAVVVSPLLYSTSIHYLQAISGSRHKALEKIPTKESLNGVPKYNFVKKF